VATDICKQCSALSYKGAGILQNEGHVPVKCREQLKLCHIPEDTNPQHRSFYARHLLLCINGTYVHHDTLYKVPYIGYFVSILHFAFTLSSHSSCIACWICIPLSNQQTDISFCCIVLLCQGSLSGTPDTFSSWLFQSTFLHLQTWQSCSLVNDCVGYFLFWAGRIFI